MEISERQGVFFVSGDITEACDLSKTKFPKGPVKFDLGGVRTINSCGVREWIGWINKLTIQPIYLNCPQAVVMQFNMVREFLGNDARVESFQVPAYCENCGQQKLYLLNIGKDFQPGTALEEYEIKKCQDESCSIESDVDFESYFYFIEELPK